MDVFCLRRFDGQSKLLVRCLLSGTGGARLAMKVFCMQQRTNSVILLSKLIETLCQDELNCANTETLPLTKKPLVNLFPTLFKQNLLSFIHLVSPSVPFASVLQLLQCLSHESIQSPWVSFLSRQLERNLVHHTEEELYTPECNQRLRKLTQRLVGQTETSGWTQCLSGDAIEPVLWHESSFLDRGTQKKRKMSFVTQESDGEETGQQHKRVKVDMCEEDLAAAKLSGQKATLSGSEKSLSAGATLEKQEAAPDVQCHDLPEHMKETVLQFKDMLESPMEWDQCSIDVFKVFHECDPSQMELLCNVLQLSDLPEQNLPRLCNSILAATSDLSYSTAMTLVKSLFLKKVQLLSAPASRCLVTAVTSLSSRYPRPVCCALIGPILEDKDIGNPQTELLNRLIEGCLDSHYRLLVLQMSFKIPWSEDLLSIIHSLLDSKPDINEELFAQLTKQLVNQGPLFTKSVKFAKMLLTILTKYGNCVTPAHKQSLDGCLILNGTFLKKSLQAALRRITPT